jgi:hypothetical protein
LEIIDFPTHRPNLSGMNSNPDIAFEVWAPDAARKGWQIIVDRHVLGTLKSQLDAIEYAKAAAREAAEEASLHTIVVRCRPDGERLRIAVFGDPEV